MLLYKIHEKVNTETIYKYNISIVSHINITPSVTANMYMYRFVYASVNCKYEI